VSGVSGSSPFAFQIVERNALAAVRPYGTNLTSRLTMLMVGGSPQVVGDKAFAMSRLDGLAELSDHCGARQGIVPDSASLRRSEYMWPLRIEFRAVKHATVWLVRVSSSDRPCCQFERTSATLGASSKRMPSLEEC
jgi:hypothetical protein